MAERRDALAVAGLAPASSSSLRARCTRDAHAMHRQYVHTP